MSQKLPWNGFKWIENTSQFNKDFITKYNDDSDEEHFLELDIQNNERLHEFHNDLPFLHKRQKLKKIDKLLANLHDEKEYFHLKGILKSIKSWIIIWKNS